MATVQNNSITKGLTGRIGNLVFRQVHGQTVVTPKARKPQKQSELQRQNRSKFKLASAWAKHTLLHTDKKAYYSKIAKKLKLPNAYTAAVSDYLRKGEIKDIDVRQYKGKAGNTIRIKVRKQDFMVNKASVAIYDNNGNRIEASDAVKKDHQLFVYTCTNSISDNTPVRISVTLGDHELSQVTKEMEVGSA